MSKVKILAEEFCGRIGLIQRVTYLTHKYGHQRAITQVISLRNTVDVYILHNV
jgi:hypothetical protein